MLAHEDNLHDSVPYGAAHDLCYLCNDYCGAPYFATGVMIDMEGELCIGKGCADTITRIFGGLNRVEAAEAKMAQSAFDQQQAELDYCVEMLDAVRTAVNA